MGRIAMGLIVWTGLMILFALAFLALYFVLGVMGVLEETQFHNRLIWLLGQGLDAVVWALGRTG